MKAIEAMEIAKIVGVEFDNPVELGEVNEGFLLTFDNKRSIEIKNVDNYVVVEIIAGRGDNLFGDNLDTKIIRLSKNYQILSTEYKRTGIFRLQ